MHWIHKRRHELTLTQPKQWTLKSQAYKNLQRKYHSSLSSFGLEPESPDNKLQTLKSLATDQILWLTHQPVQIRQSWHLRSPTCPPRCLAEFLQAKSACLRRRPLRMCCSGVSDMHLPAGPAWVLLKSVPLKPITFNSSTKKIHLISHQNSHQQCLNQQMKKILRHMLLLSTLNSSKREGHCQIPGQVAL